MLRDETGCFFSTSLYTQLLLIVTVYFDYLMIQNTHTPKLLTFLMIMYLSVIFRTLAKTLNNAMSLL